MIGCGGGSTNVLFVCWRRFILLSVFDIIKFFDPHCQLHPYVLPLRLFQNVVVSWCLGTLLLHAVTLCSHLPCIHKYLFAKSGEGLWCCPCLGSVVAWRVGRRPVLRLMFFLPVLFVLSSSVSVVGASVVCCSLSWVGYWIQHLCQNWILGLVEQLAQ